MHKVKQIGELTQQTKRRGKRCGAFLEPFLEGEGGGGAEAMGQKFEIRQQIAENAIPALQGGPHAPSSPRLPQQFLANLLG